MYSLRLQKNKLNKDALFHKSQETERERERERGERIEKSIMRELHTDRGTNVKVRNIHILLLYGQTVSQI